VFYITLDIPRLPECSRSIPKVFPKCFECVVSVCVRHLRVSEHSLSETLAILFQGSNVRSLVFKNVIMLLVLCLVIVVSLITLENPFGLAFLLA
jgi:hypothetical protein